MAQLSTKTKENPPCGEFCYTCNPANVITTRWGVSYLREESLRQPSLTCVRGNNGPSGFVEWTNQITGNVSRVELTPMEFSCPAFRKFCRARLELMETLVEAGSIDFDSLKQGGCVMTGDPIALTTDNGRHVLVRLAVDIGIRSDGDMAPRLRDWPKPDHSGLLKDGAWWNLRSLCNLPVPGSIVRPSKRVVRLLE
jgi:hypothetical protein